VNAARGGAKTGVLASSQCADAAYAVREAQERVTPGIGILDTRPHLQAATCGKDNSPAETATMEAHARQARRQQKRTRQRTKWSPNSSYRAAMSAPTTPILSSISGSFISGTAGRGQSSDRDRSNSKK
jgi:hypothetical protein